MARANLKSVEPADISRQALQEFKELVKGYQSELDARVKEYEKVVQEGAAKLEQIVAGQPKPKVTPEPVAAWLKTDDGEDYLVLDQPAAALFAVILDRVSEVVQELQKSVK